MTMMVILASIVEKETGVAAERPDCNHAIRSDADVAVAEVPGHRRDLRRGLPAGFDQDEVVAETMPF